MCDVCACERVSLLALETKNGKIIAALMDRLVSFVLGKLDASRSFKDSSMKAALNARR